MLCKTNHETSHPIRIRTYDRLYSPRIHTIENAYHVESNKNLTPRWNSNLRSPGFAADAMTTAPCIQGKIKF
jgi:hypothetical protein